MRKCISIILLGIWLFNILGGVGYFLIQLHYQKQTMRQLLATTPKDQLTRIQLTISTLNQSRYEANELLIDGRMFDLAFEIHNGNEVIVYGLFDNDEDMLLCSLREQSRQQSDCPASTNAVAEFMSLTFLAETFHTPEYPEAYATFNLDPRSIIYTDSDLQHLRHPPEKMI